MGASARCGRTYTAAPFAAADARPAADGASRLVPEKCPAGNSASVRTRRIREFAREVLGYDDCRPGQEEVMPAVVFGQHTLAVLSSGAGKTAIYQIAGHPVRTHPPYRPTPR
jgi:ATP-dependent DNA helicase RecQ